MSRRAPVRTGLAAAVPVENQGMIANLEAQPPRHRVLARLDAIVDELLDMPTVKTHDMIVMGALIEL